jgi:hypothetical protein
MASLALLYFFGSEELPVIMGRHAWTVESSRGEVRRSFYCPAQSQTWYSSDVLMLAKAEQAYAVTDPPTLTYSLMVIPHQPTEIATARLALLRHSRGHEESHEESLLELSVSDIVAAIRNYIMTCAYLYYLAYTVLAQYSSPDMMYILTITFTPWSLLETRTAEIVNMLMSGMPREEIIRILSRKTRHTRCRCPQHPLGLVYNYAKLLREVAREEDMNSQRVRIGSREVDLAPNLCVIVDNANMKSTHVMWSHVDIDIVKAEHVVDLIKHAKREVLVIAYMDMLKPQTVTLIHVAVL